MPRTAKHLASRGKEGLPRTPRRLSPAAERALAEALARRQLAAEKKSPKEVHGRGGLDPVRYGDWEVKG
ncbi:MAG TPA: DUF1674 domain-containing protein, partial [Hyphomicrobiales bacterium]|nr:DUF1674 domain-containing protein [Hyphomicrobiales bacterium]